MLACSRKACKQILTNSPNHFDEEDEWTKTKSISRPVSAKRDRFRPFWQCHNDSLLCVIPRPPLSDSHLVRSKFNPTNISCPLCLIAALTPCPARNKCISSRAYRGRPANSCSVLRLQSNVARCNA